MALQHKSRPETTVNWINCTDDSINKQNEYQDKQKKKAGLVLKYTVRAYFP